MQITEHKDAINCIDIMEGIALDFKAPSLIQRLPTTQHFCLLSPFLLVQNYVSLLFVSLLCLEHAVSTFCSFKCSFPPEGPTFTFLPSPKGNLTMITRQERPHIQNITAATHPKNSSHHSTIENSICDSLDQEDGRLLE